MQHERPSEWPFLGATRFLLALVVAGAHTTGFAGRDNPAAVLAGFSGFVAICGFLVVSGYSIAASFEKDPAGFYFRRALRIVPLYVLLVVGSGMIPIFFPAGVFFDSERVLPPPYEQVVLNLCFAQNFLTQPIATNPAVWTISLEVFFYAFTPLFAKLQAKTILWLGLASAILYLNCRAIPWTGVYFASLLGGLNVLFLAWAWLLGFWMQRQRGDGRAIWLVMGVGLVLFSINRRWTEKWWIFTWALPFLSIHFGRTTALSSFQKKLALFLGDISYPLYLAHLPVYLILSGIGGPRLGIAYLAMAILCAAALDRFYDRPVKRSIRRAVATFRPAHAALAAKE